MELGKEIQSGLDLVPHFFMRSSAPDTFICRMSSVHVMSKSCEIQWTRAKFYMKIFETLGLFFAFVRTNGGQALQTNPG